MASGTKCPPVIVCDFETHGIEPRPKYPPKPVSLALKWPDQRDYKLMAWGHGDGSKAAGNNCTEKEARGEYVKARNSRYPMLFQNGSFDQDVAEVAWEIPLLPWERYHETMFLLFLQDPHSPSLALKPCAERYLGIKPEEQDRVRDWVLSNVPEAAHKPSTWGAYIWRCPYQIVKPYHKGDLTRTQKLFEYLYPRIVDAGMLEAYQRELKLMPILLRNARRGMRVDVNGLERDLPAMKAGVVKADDWLRKRLGDINLDSDKQLGEALLSTGAVRALARTPKGQLSVSKKTLTLDKFADERVFQTLSYRSKMSTCISMFIEPWLCLAASDGMIHANWSQVRTPKGGGDDTNGARSGRIICTKPNFLNIPKKFKKDISAGYVHPAFLKIPDLPYIRTYCLPDEKELWGRRDYNQQEVRLFGHFEEGPVMQGFLDNPRFDMHEGVRVAEEDALVAAGLRESFDRDSAKGSVFGAFYGQGLTGLMITLRLRDPEDRGVGKIIHTALHHAVPSIKGLSDQLKALAQEGRPIRTIGGRLYYCEPPKYSEKFGRDMSYEYKLISYLIQGSGADVAKEAIVRYDAHPKRRGRLLVSVYDEIDFSCAKNAMKEEMKILRECMLTSIPCDVPLLSDGETGLSWGDLKSWED